MTIITSTSQPPTHLVRDLGDESGPFMGSWTHERWHARSTNRSGHDETPCYLLMTAFSARPNTWTSTRKIAARNSARRSRSADRNEPRGERRARFLML